MTTITNTQFSMCASKLKCMTGDDLDTVGMQSECHGVEIGIKGDADTDYLVNVYAFAVEDNGIWVVATPTASQVAGLQAVLSAEVLRITERRGAEMEKVWANMEAENQAAKYGREDTLYNSTY